MTSADFARRFPGAIILPWSGVWPTIAESAFIAPGAVVVGNVEIGEESSIWFNTVLRGDIAPIRVGHRTSVQDNSLVHVNMDAPAIIGNDVTIGHCAVIHGTTIDDGALIGMGALILSYSHVGAGAVVSAGAVVTERMDVAPHTVVMGVPAKPRDPLGDEQIERLAGIPGRYVRVSRQYMQEVHANYGKDSE